MKKRDMLLGLVAIAAFACGGAASAGKAPIAVEQTISKIFGPKVAIDHERENGQDLYEVEVKSEMSVTFDALGAVKDIEVEIPLGLVPASVMSAAEGHLPSGTKLHEAALILRGSHVFYEVEAKDGSGKNIEIMISSDGNLDSRASDDQVGEKDDEQDSD